MTSLSPGQRLAPGPPRDREPDGFGLFLVHDGESFELLVSGCLVGGLAAQSVLRAISLLPGMCVSLLDLGEVSELDERTARAMHEAVAARRDAGALICLVCPSEQLRAPLISAGFVAAVDLHQDPAGAHHSLLTGAPVDVAS